MVVLGRLVVDPIPWVRTDEGSEDSFVVAGWSDPVFDGVDMLVGFHRDGSVVVSGFQPSPAFKAKTMPAWQCEIGTV